MKKQDLALSQDNIRSELKSLGFKQSAEEGELMLLELLAKAAAGFYNSHTEELFLKSFALLRKDRTLNKKGARFMCDMVYTSSNKKPRIYYLAWMHREPQQ